MPSPKTKLKTIPVNVYMEPFVKAMLKKLAQEEAVPMSQIIREAIVSRYRHSFANEPHCANSTECRCPAMHSIQPKERLSDEDLIRQHGGSNVSQLDAPAA